MVAVKIKILRPMIYRLIERWKGLQDTFIAFSSEARAALPRCVRTEIAKVGGGAR